MFASAGRLFTATFAMATLTVVAKPVEANTIVSMDVHFAGRSHSAGLLKAIWTEVSAIWSSYGVQVVAAPECESEDGGGIVGSFDVAIEQRATHKMKSNRLVLGLTYLQVPAIDHAPIRIDYGAVEEVLEALQLERLVMLTGHQGLESSDMGRALGRVLAHEIGHVLLLAPDHKPSGLMRASYRPEDLVGIARTSFTLSQLEIERLHRRAERLSVLFLQ